MLGEKCMFFKLNAYAYLILGESESSIYDLLNGKIHFVPKEISEELWKLDSGKLEFESAFHKDFYEKLISDNLGKIYNTNVNIEKIRIGLPKFIDNIASRKIRIYNLYLQIENKCNLNCSFCYSDSRNYKMTGCRQYKIKSNIDLALYKRAIFEAFGLGCRTLHLLGGEPLLRINIIIDLIEYAETIGYSAIYIYTNGLLITEDIINKIWTSASFVIQLTTENYLETDSQIKEKFASLCRSKLNYFINICVSNKNFADEKIIFNDLNSYNPLGIVKTFIHRDLENNDYRKYVVEELLSNECTTDEYSFQANIDHHPCLNGKIVVFRDGSVGVCPMIPDGAIYSLYESNLHKIITSDYIKAMWNRPISTHSSCEVCSLRLYCSDCIAITRSIDEEHIRAFCRKELKR